MQRAIELARGGWGQTAPNPMVGAVIVRDGQVVGEGFHARFGGVHAEVAALAVAGDRAMGATMYVTLEPCAHVGKTPPCVVAITQAGVRRVVVAVEDPNPLASGGRLQLNDAGIDVTMGVCRAEATWLDPAFHFAFTSDRAWVTLKMAVSLDAALADVTHTTSRVTGEVARQYAHRLRAGHDAVAVGMRTVQIDNPQLTVRDAPAARIAPTRVVFSCAGVLPPECALARSASQIPVVVTRRAAAARVCEPTAGVCMLQSPSLGDDLRLLKTIGIRSVLVEGGAEIAGALWNAGLVDQLILLQAPVIFGAGALPAFGAVPAQRAGAARRLRVVSREVLGDDLATTYELRTL